MAGITRHPAERAWQVLEISAEECDRFLKSDMPLSDVTPLWVTYADTFEEASEMAGLLIRNGKYSIVRPTPKSPVTNPNALALLHVMGDPSAKLSNGKTLQEHLASLAF